MRDKSLAPSQPRPQRELGNRPRWGRMPQGRPARAAFLVLALCGTVGFGYLSVRDVHLGQMWRDLRASNYWWVFPSVALTVVTVAIRTQRWRLLFRSHRRPLYRDAAGALLVSYFFNNILPARAGELARVIDLKRRGDISRAETSATVVLERLYDVVGLGLLLFLFLHWLPDLTWLRSVEVLLGIVLGCLTAAGLVLALFGNRPLRLALRPLTRAGVPPQRIDRIVDSAGHGLAAIRDVKMASAVMLWTVGSWLVAAASAWVLMYGFRLHLPYTAAVVVVVAVNLAQVLPSLPSGLGVVEAACVLALRAYGVGSSQALAYALVYHLLNFLPFVAAGPAVLGGRRRTPGSKWARTQDPGPTVRS